MSRIASTKSPAYPQSRRASRLPSVSFPASPSLMRATPQGDLPGHELRTAPRRLMVEQDAADREHAVRLAVVLRDEVPVGLRDAVRAARVERRALVLRRLAHLAEHLRGGRLVETDLAAARGTGAADAADDPDRLQHAQHAHAGDLGGDLGLLPGHRHEGDRAEVVDLVGPYLLHGGDQAALVEQVAMDEPHLADVLAQPGHVRVGLSPDQTPDVVPLREQMLGEVRAVLPGDPGDERSRGQRNLQAHGAMPRYVSQRLAAPPGARRPEERPKTESRSRFGSRRGTRPWNASRKCEKITA